MGRYIAYIVAFESPAIKNQHSEHQTTTSAQTSQVLAPFICVDFSNVQLLKAAQTLKSIMGDTRYLIQVNVEPSKGAQRTQSGGDLAQVIFLQYSVADPVRELSML
eukprot:gb/GECG01009158.1/.p1 GENE.gb/GECG01009158.1/~~gb/GECG01009158.1/.p1  ORF type:complete len:106 (+),score=6.87 gb/GECG01009158.1/:1-318(+)